MTPKLMKPNYIDNNQSNEITLHARDLDKTGSKHLELFSSSRGPLQYRVGDEFMSGDRRYIIEKITDGM